MSIIKHVTLQKIVANDFRYDPRNWRRFEGMFYFCFQGEAVKEDCFILKNGTDRPYRNVDKQLATNTA